MYPVTNLAKRAPYRTVTPVTLVSAFYTGTISHADAGNVRFTATRLIVITRLRILIRRHPPLWRVEWVETRNGKTDTMGHSHYTEAAARQHVRGLLGQVDPALGNVYTEDAAAI
jgi:hypothetical protein